jgi:hypothetical protein
MSLLFNLLPDIKANFSAHLLTVNWTITIELREGHTVEEGCVSHYIWTGGHCGFTAVLKKQTKKKTKLHGLSPRANYTHRATAACRRSDCQLLLIERVPRGQCDGSLWPYFRFSRQEPLLFYQVAPQLYSRG